MLSGLSLVQTQDSACRVASPLPTGQGAVLGKLHPLQSCRGKACTLGQKEFSMAVASPSSSPLPNNGSLSLPCSLCHGFPLPSP